VNPPSLPVVFMGCFSRTRALRKSYLLAVQTALVSLDGDEFLATDGETVGEGIVGGGESSSQGVDVILGKLDFIRFGCFCVDLVIRGTYLEPGGARLQAGEVGGKNTSLVELTRAHQAVIVVSVNSNFIRIVRLCLCRYWWVDGWVLLYGFATGRRRGGGVEYLEST